MENRRLAEFLKGAWGALVGLEEAASALREESDGVRDTLTRVGHRLAESAERAELLRLAALGRRLERFGTSFPPREHPSFADAEQLIGETLNVLPMVFDNVASEGSEEIPQLGALEWRFDAEIPAAEALMAERAAAAAPGEVDLELESFRRRDPEALSFFGPEAEEHVESLRAGFERLRVRGGSEGEETGSDDGSDVLRDLFRHAHTIKGAAYTVGCEPIGRLTHALEDLLAVVRRGRRRPNAAELEVSAAAVDLAGEMLDRLGGQPGPPLQGAFEEALEALGRTVAAGEESPRETTPRETTPPLDDADDGRRLEKRDETREPGPAPAASFQPTVRVELAKLDRLLGEAGEVVLARRRLERSLRGLEELRENLLAMRHRMLERPRASRPELARPELARPDSPTSDPESELVADLAELGQDVRAIAAEVEAQLGELTTRTRRLRADIGQLRRRPAGQLFERFLPMIRERAEALGLSVRVETRGEDVALDSEVMERLVEPLTHLVQNALHHGLEGETERLDAGKGRVGTLTLEARGGGKTVTLSVADDGRGLDLERLRRRAAERGFAVAGGAGSGSDPGSDPKADEALELLALPGLSTEDEVSTGAGRGVGMDAVRQAVAGLGGRLEVESERGRGSRFRLDVPATLMISEALLVRAGGRRFAVPLPAVDRLLHIDDTLLVEQEGARFLDDAGEKIELISTAERLHLEPGTTSGAPGVAIRLAGAHRDSALEVEEVFGVSEIVMKSLGSFLSATPWIAGAFVDGDGDVVLLLDPQAMLERSEEGAGARDPRAQARAASQALTDDQGPTLLIADDSLSVRRVLARRLGRAGYRVLTARDGAEALEKLAEHEVDGLITDLEMPHLAGDVLIRRLRRRPRWRELPILVVTGRAAALGEDRLGADAVFSKPVAEGVLESWLARRFAASPLAAERRAETGS